MCNHVHFEIIFHKQRTRFSTSTQDQCVKFEYVESRGEVDTRPWLAGRLACQKQGGDLAVFYTHQQLAAVRHLYEKGPWSELAFVGLRLKSSMKTTYYRSGFHILKIYSA